MEEDLLETLAADLDLDLDLDTDTLLWLEDPQTDTGAEPKTAPTSTKTANVATTEEVNAEAGIQPDEGAAKAKEPSSSANAVRLRRHRLKKKQERERMQEENLALKRGRKEYLKQIADLEFEVETLRVRGVLDLSKENDLLKVEIKKHKLFIDRVVETALNTPNEADEVEQIRVLHNGVESGARHMKGLAYASHSSDLWKRANPFALRLSEDLALPHVKVWFQYLPVDAPKEDAKRMNLRLEMGDLPLDYRKMARAYWKITSTPELVQEQLEKGEKSDVLNIHAEMAVRNQRLPSGEDVAGFFLKTGSCADALSFFLAAYKEDVIYSTAIPDAKIPDGSDSGLEMAMVFNTTCDSLPKAVPDEVQSVQDLHVDGYMFRESPTGGTSITFVQSVPLSGPLFDFVIDGVLKKRRLISDEGEVHPLIINFQEDRLSSAFAHYEE